MPSKHPKHDAAPWRNFYGRRKGKALRPAQEVYLREDLGDVLLGGVDWDSNPERVPLDLADVFPGADQHWLEIGFGGGEHLAHQAARNPNVGLIGCEPFINGVAMLLGKLRGAGVDNIAVHPGDARDLFDVIAPESLDRVFLLYPDPWPKKKHHRRRFVTPEFLGPLNSIMKPGATLRIATDIEDYVRQSLQEVPKAGFIWTSKRPSDWREPWSDWHSTRYEQKALREGRTPHYLTFRKP